MIKSVQDKRFWLGWLFLVPVFGLGMAQLLLSCTLSTYGEEIASLSARKEELERESQTLRNEAAVLSSLSFIRQRAEDELGMHKAEVDVVCAARLARLLPTGD